MEEVSCFNVDAVAEAFTESEAFDLLSYFERKFGWAGLLFNREDATDIWHNDHDEDIVLSDAEWEAVKQTQPWLRLGEYLSQDAFDLVREAVSVAKFNVKATQIYTVWVGGVALDDGLVDYDDAVFLALFHDAQGHDDVKIVNTKDDTVIARSEWVDA
jgi:hypothetical protein